MKVQALSTDFDENSYEDVINTLNTVLTNIGLDNFAGQIVDNITIASGVELKVPHALKYTPKYMIILRQRGDGSVVDGVVDIWTDKYVVLKNVGAAETTISIFLFGGS